MKILRVIESKHWRHTSGRTASIYGSLPWTGRPGDRQEDWTMVTAGYTWENSNGTIGLGRVPAKTFEEAEQVMIAFNARFAPKTAEA